MRAPRGDGVLELSSETSTGKGSSGRLILPEKRGRAQRGGWARPERGTGWKRSHRTPRSALGESKARTEPAGAKITESLGPKKRGRRPPRWRITALWWELRCLGQLLSVASF